jgi:Flp pilus assembly protein TadG
VAEIMRGWRFLRRDNKAGMAIMTVLAAMPLFLFTGGAIDFARQVQAYRGLQNAVDEATLAGATLLSESNYATDIPPLVNAYLTAATKNLNASVTLPASITVTSSSVTVSVSASLQTTLLSLVMASLPVSVSAKAGGPSGTVSVTATPDGTNAADLNTVYVYSVSANGTKNLSSKVELFDNTGSLTYLAGVPVSVSFQLGLGERIAFELTNQTGGRNPAWYTGTTNAYGSVTGNTQEFYSSDYPASLNTTNSANGYTAANQTAAVNAHHVYFDSVSTACYVSNNQPVTLTNTTSNPNAANTIYGSITTSQQQNVLVNGVCANVTPGSPYNISPTCLELNGQTLNIIWNDMGNTSSIGDNDQYVEPFHDMAYSFTCAGTSAYSRVVLLK